MKDIKLIALDMDGTLLDEHHKVSRENDHAIKEAEKQGVTVVLSTGRSIRRVRDYVVSLQLSSYLVTINGSEIWGPSGELVERNPLMTPYLQWMLDLSKTHKAKYWAVSTTDNWYNEVPEDVAAHEWLKFGFDIKDDAVRDTILGELRKNNNLEISNSSLTNIEVNALGVNKAKGLRRVCELLGVSMENVMAVGDSLNDISMIKESGLGVAMGNAQPVVKEAADWITGSNTGSGVAQAIRKWVL
ncbi:Cof-type HAD-IIB family hydrolase [Mesobacillus zeae]